MNRPSDSNPHGFPQTTTHLWGLAKESGSLSEPHARAAFGMLAQEYANPIRNYLRGWAHNENDLDDLVQGFLCDAIENDTFSKAERERVRFRIFLLCRLSRYVIDEYRRGTALKRNPIATSGCDLPSVAFR